MSRMIPVVLVFLLIACKKDLTPVTPVHDPVDTTGAVAAYRGSFTNGPYGTVSGSAAIIAHSTGYSVALVNVQVSNGPDLHVYLSKEQQPVHFIDAGKLKSTSGTQVYPLSSVPDFTQYKYVLIHCQKFNHLFGSAEIEP